MKTLQLLMVLGTLLINSVLVADPVIAPNKIKAPNPAVKNQIQKAMPLSQKQALKSVTKPRLKVVSITPEWVYPCCGGPVVWCDGTSAEQTTLWLTSSYSWSQEPHDTRVGVQMIVQLPNGVQKTQHRYLYGGGGDTLTTVHNEAFTFSRRDMCPASGPQLCVQVRYAVVNPADTNRIDQTWRRVCTPWGPGGPG